MTGKGMWVVLALLAIGPASVVHGYRDDALAASADEAKARDVALPPDLGHIAFSGGNGSSCEAAVVIEHAKNVAEGVGAEKAWLATHYPQARVVVKAQSGEKNRFFETVELRSKDGATVRICFDITGFFGKL